MVIIEDNEYVIHGPPTSRPIPRISLGKLAYNSLIQHSSKTEDALIDAVTGESISYKEILGKTCSLAHSLLKNGYRKDTVITVSSENNREFFIPVISALYIGAIVAPMNFNYTHEESIHSLNICKPRIIFCSKNASLKYVKLKKLLTYIEKVIIIDSDEEVLGCDTLNNFICKSLGDTVLYQFPVVEVNVENQIAFVMCSSGTTGLPKGVMQSHLNIIVRYLHTIDKNYYVLEKSVLGIMPFFHGYGFLTMFFALVLAQKIVIIKRFEEKVFFEAIQKYKISALVLAPPLVLLMAKSPLVEKYDWSFLKDVISGAAPLSKETEKIAKRRLNLKTIRQGYGLTEATLAILTTPSDVERYGSSGKVMTYMSCKIRDPDTGKSLGPNQIGEICVKGPMLMLGYYGNEEATRNSFTSDGWLLTGDLAYYDKDEYFYIVDRLKELIKFKGFQVAPAELEGLLLDHPKIKDAGVVGLPDEEAGELPLAFVVKKPNVSLTEKEVIDFIAEKVSSQKKLRGGVIFVPEIPKNPSGKILRKELRKMLTTYKSKL